MNNVLFIAAFLFIRIIEQFKEGSTIEVYQETDDGVYTRLALFNILEKTDDIIKFKSDDGKIKGFYEFDHSVLHFDIRPISIPKINYLLEYNISFSTLECNESSCLIKDVDFILYGELKYKPTFDSFHGHIESIHNGIDFKLKIINSDE